VIQFDHYPWIEALERSGGTTQYIEIEGISVDLKTVESTDGTTEHKVVNSGKFIILPFRLLAPDSVYTILNSTGSATDGELHSLDICAGMVSEVCPEPVDGRRRLERQDAPSGGEP
jgi:hypothetical protein